ncbi:hypothetical protein TOT_040000505 [Theileria orientalis strain Shintoku]|uniref:Uncharacterized protein n=1 Tax=Theileria orientalis strain Shintoku TaxID=869250 RepID=J4DAQ7_THEOR|nr:hypothetical protein TOT_040000505 [Theileria orientalis strain Shintoku]PVC50857.1 hypothetical protein MACL_00002008 [Theileria orientalis]BAM42135.1 hypothetical protein TOT_040000505 [Theileria orientalis strain Shintoku]|eukprot:XP_009692436.1 hypothetical protein TOT_040000505 [Theileria orientalis strain Shintoku]
MKYELEDTPNLINTVMIISYFCLLFIISPVSVSKAHNSLSSSALNLSSTHYTLNSSRAFSSFSHNLNPSSSSGVFTHKLHWFLPCFYRSFFNLLNVVSSPYCLSPSRPISTLKRRKFKIKKHKKKKRMKRMSKLNVIVVRAPSDEKPPFRCPAKVRRIVKERRARNKGNRTLRAPRQR